MPITIKVNLIYRTYTFLADGYPYISGTITTPDKCYENVIIDILFPIHFQAGVENLEDYIFLPDPDYIQEV